MHELRRILSARRALAAEGHRTVLITLVEVTGSAYRRPGARMLVDDGGATVGAVSSGCLEGDLAERARSVIREGRVRVVDYDLEERDDLTWGLGMGCPGRVRLLLEPMDAGLTAVLDGVAAEEGPVVLGTLFEAGPASGLEPGDRFALAAGADLDQVPGSRAVGDGLITAVQEVLAAGRPRTARLGEDDGAIGLLLERLDPPFQILIFGSGADARHLARLAVELGWETVLLAPGAEEVARRGDLPVEVTAIGGNPVTATEGLRLDGRTAAVLLSHHFERDRALLERLLPSKVGYIGLLGSGPRRRSLFEAVGEGLVTAAGDRLHAPVGLDLGAERPEEIALAVAGEIQAALRGRNGGFLRDRDHPIHDR